MIRELKLGETHLAHAAMLELRPRIGTATVFAEHVNTVQRPEGYRLVGVFIDGEEQALAVAGFRVMNHLAWGRALYCDDRSCRAAFRRRGHAGQLVDWMLAESARVGADEFHLDSGVGADRTDAHRLYHNKGMRISSHHLVRELTPRG